MLSRLSIIVFPFIGIILLAILGVAIKRVIDVIRFLNWFLEDK